MYINYNLPESVKVALLHVNSKIPDITKVVFWSDYRWTYMTDTNDAPDFSGAGIDEDILEYALNDIVSFPAAFELYLD